MKRGWLAASVLLFLVAVYFTFEWVLMLPGSYGAEYMLGALLWPILAFAAASYCLNKARKN